MFKGRPPAAHHPRRFCHTAPLLVLQSSRSKFGQFHGWPGRALVTNLSLLASYHGGPNEVGSDEANRLRRKAARGRLALSAPLRRPNSGVEERSFRIRLMVDLAMPVWFTFSKFTHASPSALGKSEGN
jgi:hypothetical protein